ncbi:MAG: apolipoprotein N-acyltransferase [Janthinobacterium lividum]
MSVMPVDRLPPAWRVGLRADVVAWGLGVLSAFALPPFHVLPVLLLSVPGLLVLVGTARRQVGALRRGFWFGFGLHLVGLYWITEAILLESARYWWFVPIAVPALSAVLAAFIAVPCWVAWRTQPGWRRVVMLAGMWLLCDLARQYIGTGFPWNPWGSVWAVPGWFGDVMIQPAAWVGTPGLTLFTVLIAGLPVLGRRGWALGAAMLAAWAGAGVWRLRDPEPPAPGLAVVLVQGNVAQGQKWDRDTAVATFDRHLRLSAEGVAAAGARPSVVVWPETASVFLLQSDANARAAIAQAVAPALGAIVGSLTFTDGAPSADPSNLPRNTLVALDAGAAITGLYHKWHLVPFGEYAPSWVPLAIQVVPGRFAFGQGPETLRIPGVPAFGGLICYEAIFPAQVVDEANRPDWLVNITNDAWFGNSTGPRQHLAAARLRAVEEGLPLMRAANTGISAGFDSRGRELARLPLGEAGTLVLDLPGKRTPTSFSRWGLVVPGLLGCAFIGLVVIGRIRRPHRV